MKKKEKKGIILNVSYRAAKCTQPVMRIEIGMRHTSTYQKISSLAAVQPDKKNDNLEDQSVFSTHGHSGVKFMPSRTACSKTESLPTLSNHRRPYNQDYASRHVLNETHILIRFFFFFFSFFRFPKNGNCDSELRKLMADKYEGTVLYSNI